MSKRCRVVCDTPSGVLECELELADEASIAAALEAARFRLGETTADWQQAPTGIFGRLQAREYVPADGDRIELYRALKIEPREARRVRAAGRVR
jgi:putative ubiquitin-RnfH superfamily antitoxin RatB of RatAB toxin-antitoxin module